MGPIGPIEPGSAVAVARPTEGGAGFGNELAQALSSLDASQRQADTAAAALAAGGGNLHETALALEKADIAMRVAVKARNKVVEAYQEVMRMSL
ncbi:flagellar hook-basal body complex protein FliE [Vulgatibacter sp.]|uniref:flagellar hook-basal body complex protein FliE n=1 Tax=Vulgatibacter sp. TaxID=1971226 RepID=UPI003565DD4B